MTFCAAVGTMAHATASPPEIFLTTTNPVASPTARMLDQAFEVKGRVVDANNQPLPGVTVALKNTTIGTVTDANGYYSLSLPDASGTLVFSSISYTTLERAVNGQTTINVQLTTSVSQLNQLVVTGYSSQVKKDITGSVDVVDMDAIKSIPSGSAAGALQGQASGVTIINSGAPGGGSNVFIRGITSFGDTQPLVLIDGVPSNLQDINSDNIASIQVLKDAGAAAIYGVRGSNGVIIITTKKGVAGTPKVVYDGYYGYQVPPSGNVLNIAGAEDYAQFVYRMQPNTELFPGGSVPDYTYAGPGVNGIGNEGDAAVDPSHYVFDAANPASDYLIQRLNKTRTDWFHAIFKPAPIQNHNITVSGGSEKSHYLFSLGYFNQQGTLIETYLKRYSARINTEFNVSDHIRVGENAYIFYKQNPPFSNQDQDNAIFFAYTMPSFIPIHDIMGNYGGTWIGPLEMGNRWNPVALMENTANNKAHTWDIVGNVYAEVDFLRHFTIRSSFGGTIDNQYDYNFMPNRYQDREQHNLINSYNENALYNSSWIWTNTLTYQQSFGKHNIKVLAGSEAINNYGRNVGGSASGFFSTDPNYLVLNNGTFNIANQSGAYANTLYSLFARADYSFADKYLLTATVRRDGSSKFGPEKTFGVFPSFSAGWRLSNESFIKSISWINDLKLRGSWGILGSQNNVPSFNAHTLYSSGFSNSYYDISGSNSIQQGFYQSSIGNPNTGWEEDIVTNFGIDATLFNYALDFSVDWYDKSIKGLLFPQPLPVTVGGASSPIINIGNIRNKGWDISITYHGKSGPDFAYHIKAMFTTYKNTVAHIPDPGYFDVGIVRNQVGHPVSSFFGYQVVGYFQDSADVTSSPEQEAAAPGRLKYKDVDGNGEINTDDRTFIGNPNPKFTYGLNLNATYRNIDLGIIFYGSQGNQVYNALHSTLTHWAGFPEALSNDLVLHGWTPDNPNPKAPIAENSSNFSQGSRSSFYVEDGSFLKCRSVILGYTVKPALFDRLGITQLRVYVQGTNLFDITGYSGLDPELQGSSEAFGIDNSNYPNNFKQYILGVNLSF
jgi:TonB-linked SusC/RagA family outer membrane protein